jgi:hypothetical protein
VLFGALALDSLAGLGAANLHDVAACGPRAEVVVEADDPVHLGPGQVQVLRDDRHQLGRHVAEPVLDLMEDRQ